VRISIFYWKNIAQKIHLKLEKRKQSDFGGFQSPEAREKNILNSQIFTFDFYCVAKK
jgi:hypothetical protein